MTVFDATSASRHHKQKKAGTKCLPLNSNFSTREGRMSLRRLDAMRLLFAAVVAFIASPANAQHSHELHHNVYQNWVNKQGKGCCNNHDCGELAESDERTNGSLVEVRIEGQWCPVQRHMYLKLGNAPNWSTSHVCVLNRSHHAGGPCDRLICYQPKPGI